MKDYYETLGVAKTASTDEIKEAYRQLARKWHPDMHQEGKDEAESKFKEINSAFEVLQDPTKRKNYDLGFDPNQQRPRSGFNPFGGHDPFESVYSRFFHDNQQTGEHGSHIVEKIEITLEEVYTGCTKEVKYQRQKVCEKCRGQGGTTKTCDRCQGQGWEQLVGANLVIRKPCGQCGGKGQAVAESCVTCDGEGLIAGSEEVAIINIPKGVESGMQMTYKGAGQPGRFGGQNGHLVIVIEVQESEFFEREARTGNVYCDVPVTYSQLVLGCSIDVPTFQNNASLKIPAGTQPGTKFRLKNKGLPVVGSNFHGDIYMCVKMEVPKNLDEKDQELVRQLINIEKTTDLQNKFAYYVNSRGK